MLRLLLAALLFVKSPADASTEDGFNRVLMNMDSSPETLEELTSDHYAVFEGDMILSTDRNAVAGPWPTLEIPYEIIPEMESRRQDILSAMAMVSKHTCVSFHQRNDETNYLLFKSSKGCSSYVGFIGGAQEVFVGPWCVVGNIVHEILHALGFHHEQTRADRDQHIKVLFHNIMDGKERNFRKLSGETFDLDYDISSIMHYGSGFFSANGQPTIVPYGEKKNMGQRDKMTKLDIERVRRLYNCDNTKKEVEASSAVTKSYTSANKSEESRTFNTTVSTAASLQYQLSATGGHTNTSRGNQTETELIKPT